MYSMNRSIIRDNSVGGAAQEMAPKSQSQNLDKGKGIRTWEASPGVFSVNEAEEKPRMKRWKYQIKVLARCHDN